MWGVGVWVCVWSIDIIIKTVICDWIWHRMVFLFTFARGQLRVVSFHQMPQRPKIRLNQVKT
jgi:hypothetical protein